MFLRYLGKVNNIQVVIEVLSLEEEIFQGEKRSDVENWGVVVDNGYVLKDLFSGSDLRSGKSQEVDVIVVWKLREVWFLRKREQRDEKYQIMYSY